MESGFNNYDGWEWSKVVGVALYLVDGDWLYVCPAYCDESMIGTADDFLAYGAIERKTAREKCKGLMRDAVRALDKNPDKDPKEVFLAVVEGYNVAELLR